MESKSNTFIAFTYISTFMYILTGVLLLSWITCLCCVTLGEGEKEVGAEVPVNVV